MRLRTASAATLAVVLVCCVAASATVSSAGAALRADRAATVLAELKLMNYYPANAGWTEMWTSWDSRTMDSDFARISALGANAVRIVVFPSAFGFPRPSPAMEDRLVHAVALAQKRHLRVVLTLFDWWSSFGEVAASRTWLRAVLAPFVHDPRVAYVELRNELPLSDQSLEWAAAMIRAVRRLDADRLVTVSVSGSDGIAGLRRLRRGLALDPPDFFDLHYYGEAALAFSTFRAARAIALPMPLFIGETGIASAGAPDLSEEAQDRYLRTVDLAAQALGLGYPAPWTFTDFTAGAIPDAVGAPATEYSFGLLRADGSPKPAAVDETSFFTRDRIDESLNNGFEQGSDEPTGWTEFAAGTAHLFRSTAVAHRGNASACISNSGGTADGVPAFMTTPVNAHVAGGAEYTLSAWARGTGIAGNDRIALAWFDGADRYIGQSESRSLGSGTTNWTQLEVVARAPSRSDHVEIHLKSEEEPGTVCFDDVTFTG